MANMAFCKTLNQDLHDSLWQPWPLLLTLHVKMELVAASYHPAGLPLGNTQYMTATKDNIALLM